MHQYERLRNALWDHGSGHGAIDAHDYLAGEGPIDTHDIRQELKDALATAYNGELDFQDAVLNVLRKLVKPDDTFSFERSYTMSYVKDYDRTLLAPSPGSKCDIALVVKNAFFVAAVIEAKCNEVIYSNTLHYRLSAEGNVLSGVQPLGPAAQTIAYIGAAVLPTMRWHQYYGPLTGAVINCAKTAPAKPAPAKTAPAKTATCEDSNL